MRNKSITLRAKSVAEPTMNGGVCSGLLIKSTKSQIPSMNFVTRRFPTLD